MEEVLKFDIIIIGAGPAGLAAAKSAADAGAKKILIIDRGFAPGGILLQCAHKGFGKAEYGEFLTGPDYAEKTYAKIADNSAITIWLDTVVLELNAKKELTCVSPERGLQKLWGKIIILAMGCREQSRGSILVPGDRLAGIITAGVAQRLINVFDYLPGQRVVVLGTGDIGVVTASELTEAGCQVLGIVERYSKPKGLEHNISHCIDDLKIPIYLSHTIIDIQGRERVEKVTIAKVDSSYRPIAGTEFTLECDTVVLSVGFRPEHILVSELPIPLDPVLGGVVADDEGRTALEGFYAAGNVIKIFESTDTLTRQAERAGRAAAQALLE